jgi:hypothetical protein
MEDENDLMSIFNSGNELNFDSQYLDEDVDNNDENDGSSNDDLDNKNKPIEGEDSEDVDGNEDDESEGDDSDDDSSPNLYSSISDVLIEQGLLPSLESSKDIKDVNTFTEALKIEIDNQTKLRIDEYLNNLDLEKIATSKKALIELDAIDENYLKENLEVAKDIILRDYINQGLSEDRARKMLRKTIDLGEDILLEDALESKESLKVFESKQAALELQRVEQEKINQAKEQEKIDNSIKQFIFDSKEVIKGIPNTKAIADKVFKTMTEVVAKNPQSGELENKFMNDRSKNPIEFDTKMYYLYELTNGFSDLSKIKTVATSSATRNLEKAIRKVKFEDNGTPGYLTDPASYTGGNFGSELVI